MKKSIIIIGAGPGIAMGVAAKFGNEGYEIGLISRSELKLKAYQSQLQEKGYTVSYAMADAGVTAELLNAIEYLQEHMAPIHAVHYNAAALHAKPIMETPTAEIIQDLKVGLFGAIETTRVLHQTLKQNQGSVLLTGGGLVDYPSAQWGSLSLAKAGIKSLASQMNNALKPEGIYVGALQINGNVKESAQEDPKYNAPAVGDQFWNLHTQRKTANLVY